MKRKIKCAIIAVLSCMILRGCYLEYNCEIVDSIPEREKEVVYRHLPDADIPEIAGYYLKNKEVIQLEAYE